MPRRSALSRVGCCDAGRADGIDMVCGIAAVAIGGRVGAKAGNMDAADGLASRAICGGGATGNMSLPSGPLAKSGRRPRMVAPDGAAGAMGAVIEGVGGVGGTACMGGGCGADMYCCIMALIVGLVRKAFLTPGFCSIAAKAPLTATGGRVRVGCIAI